MINKETKRQIAIMEAYLDGRCIQECVKGGQWYDAATPAWEWGTRDYRIVERSRRKSVFAPMACRAKTRKYIEVMRAHLQGKPIQCGRRVWLDIDYPIWNWGTADYRVKPEEGGEQ